MPHGPESQRPRHGHGHHKETQLDRIEHSVGDTEASTGRNEGRIMEMQSRMEGLENTMADMTTQLTDLKTTLVDGTTKLGTDLDILLAAFKAAPGTVTPEQQALLDGIAGIGATLKAADEKILAAVATEPPVDPNVPPITARRRI